jgi:hypothetical protein
VIFYPVFWMEAVGAGVILLLVVINLLQQRMERQPGAA